MGVHVCCCRSKARMTPCSLVRKKADVPPGVSLTLPNSKTISSGMALWQTFTCFSCGSLSLSPTPRPFHQVWLYGRHSPVSAVGLSHSPQLQDHFIRYGFMADIHLFQLWVSLTLPNSKTISSGMALWQTFTCFSCGSLSLSPTPRPFHQVWLYGRHSPVSAVGLYHSPQLQDHFIRYGFMADIHLFQQWLSAQIQDYFIRYGFLYCRHSPVSAVGLSRSAPIQDSFVMYGFTADIQL